MKTVRETFFEWDDNFNTGIQEIDYQHQRIVTYMNLLGSLRGNGLDTVRLNYVLEELSDYTINHFLFEEKLLEKAEYPYLKAHSKVHEIFAKRVADYRRRFSDGEDVTEEALIMLKNWLIRHIMEEDLAYVETVKPVSKNAAENGWIAGMVKKIFG